MGDIPLLQYMLLHLAYNINYIVANLRNYEGSSNLLITWTYGFINLGKMANQLLSGTVLTNL